MSAAVTSPGLVAGLLAAALCLVIEPALAGPTDVNGSLTGNPITLHAEAIPAARQDQPDPATPVVRRWARAEVPAVQLASAQDPAGDEPDPRAPTHRQSPPATLVTKVARDDQGQVVLTSW